MRVIAGVLPALKVTRGLGSRLKETTAGGGGLKFGGIWTAVIVSQVAITVAFPAVAFVARRAGVQLRGFDVGFPTEQYLSARLELDREPASRASGSLPNAARADTQAIFVERFTTTYQELSRRLEADPAVAGVTFANALPRMHHPDRFVEVDEGGAAPPDPRWPGWYRVSTASVEAEFFDVLGAPILVRARLPLRRPRGRKSERHREPVLRYARARQPQPDRTTDSVRRLSRVDVGSPDVQGAEPLVRDRRCRA